MRGNRFHLRLFSSPSLKRTPPSSAGDEPLFSSQIDQNQPACTARLCQRSLPYVAVSDWSCQQRRSRRPKPSRLLGSLLQSDIQDSDPSLIALCVEHRDALRHVARRTSLPFRLASAADAGLLKEHRTQHIALPLPAVLGANFGHCI
jgi:hypothetical protein